MAKRKKSTSRRRSSSTGLKDFQLTPLGIVAVVVIAVLFVAWKLKGSGPILSFGVEQNDTIEHTRLQVSDLKEIKQWEFLVIEDEEVVDSVQKGRFYDDVLMRIYFGTLRLGVDLSEMDEGDLQVQGDSVAVRLPMIRLLDEDFIDEAKTQAFYEQGRWSDDAKERLLQKAEGVMRKECLTQENFRLAQANGRQQAERFFRSLGYGHVDVTFASPVSSKEVGFEGY